VNISAQPGENEDVCSNLVQCFFFFFNNCVRIGGGVGDYLDKLSYTNLGLFYGRYFFDLSYFLLINVMLLNMVNGVIISPFGQIREEDDAKKEDIENKCFVCSIDRSVFQQHLITFEDHKSNSHNIKSYIEYLIYLTNKPDKDLDAYEFWLRDMIRNKDISCFPIKKALDDEGKVIEEKTADDILR